ncbi:MAG: carbohydrate-binding protein [Phycisphaerales bacterium]
MNDRARCLALCTGLLLGAGDARAQSKVQFTYLWHLEQPIYWPDRQVTGFDRYERAQESRVHKAGGAAHPENNLDDIFGLDDRKAVYQYRTRDCVNAIRWTQRGGAQLTYSGGLIENIMSLGSASQLGYSPSWMSSIREARGWTTLSGKPRLDVVIFPFHHALMPLVDENTMRKQVQAYKRIYPDAWGTAVPVSKGFFPSEMAFSTRMIGVLASEGINWSVVSAEKIARCQPDFPVIFGSGGINCDPPNKADQVNPANSSLINAWYRQSISRGCSPVESIYSLLPHRAKYVDPNTGAVSSIIVVPSSQGLSWRDGYSPLGTGDFSNLAALNTGSQPLLITLAHDGDNAWGGGFSYYMEATPNLVSSANSTYPATTIEQYLNDYPVGANDFAHVEDGAWVNADGDFGAPQFINWNWPLVNSSGNIDVAAGWAEDARNWAVITAMQNRVETAEAITIARPVGFATHGGTGGAPLDMGRIVYPDNSTLPAERAWHYFMGSLNSGYMYYGTSLDMEVKPTIACNNAARLADPVIASAGPTGDTVAPTIWIPQRTPWNPGSTNFGPQHKYQQVVNNGDFDIWTFAYDASGIPDGNVVLKYRLDNDGTNPLSSNQNETYAGGSEVGAWQSLTMTKRAFPAGNFFNDPGINFFVMPQYIADEYYVKLTGIRSKLVDYYVEATDSRGNIKKSPIQHVWVGDGAGASGGGGTVVALNPETPVAGQNVTVTYDPAGRNLAGAASVYLHYGFNQWTPVISPDVLMTKNAQTGKWSTTVPVIPSATKLDIVFNNGAGTWDNNGGGDWHFTVSGGQPVDTWDVSGVRDPDSTLIATSASNNINLWAGLKGDVFYMATQAAAGSNDRFLLLSGPSGPGALQTAMWGKGGQIGAWASFVGNESTNGYNGWFDVPGGNITQNAATNNGGVLSATIDLKKRFGGGTTLPAKVYVAVGTYPTADGTTPVSADCIPGATGNTLPGAIEIRLCQFAKPRSPQGCCPADLTNNGLVDDADFVVFASSYDALIMSGAYEGADLTGDGLCDDADFVAFAAAYDTLLCP